MIKTNIKMRVTPVQSRRVQEICFENGINFRSNKEKNIENNVKSLYIRDDVLTCRYIAAGEGYNNNLLKEIDADLFIKTNGTCEETYLTKYTSQPKDLHSALKKIENLHIALNKKVEKNKNQALEITKLLEQKKALQDKVDIVNNNSIEIIDTFTDNIAEYEKQLAYLKERLKEKDTIISYLESKLK